MRLEAPRELAEWLMGPQGWSRADIDRTIATAATSRVALNMPVPLYVVHRTVVVGDDGWAVFGNDVYGWDAKLTRALAGRGVTATTARLATECSGASPSAGTRVRLG
jgi:murein L,D-transpeptidase YcbB/YkuD